MFVMFVMHQTCTKHSIFWGGIQIIVHESLCGVIILLEKTSGNVIFNLIQGSWKVVVWSRKLRIETL